VLFLILKIILLILLINLLLLFIRIQIEINLIIKNGKYLSYIVLHFLYLFRIHINLYINPKNKRLISLSLDKKSKNKENTVSIEQIINYFKKTSNLYRNNIKQISFIKSKIKIKDLYLLTRIGTGDAATTALSVGSIYTFFSLLHRYLYENYCLQNLKLEVFPNFRGSMFDLKLNCIINFKIGHIIITSLKMLMNK